VSENDSGKSSPIKLNDLIALNDELAALVRSGVPLDHGLKALGRDRRGRVGKLATRLGDRLQQGASLDDALAAERHALPGFYRAVVAAGIRSGKLSSAVEGLAVFARNFAETRHAIGLALLYPLLVLILAFVLFTLFVLLVSPRYESAFEVFRLTPTWAMVGFVWLREHLITWVPIVPLIVILLLFWWRRTGRAATLQPGRMSGILRCVPGLGQILQQAQAADFAQMLALLIDNQVPLPEGVMLSAGVTGSPKLQRFARDLSEGVSRGESLATVTKGNTALPAMLTWVLATAESIGSLSPALKHAAITYRARAARQAEMLQSVLPAVILLCVGALAAVLYTTSVLEPLFMLWRGLAIPLNN
jgi:general secretion pathway protein F